MFTPRVAVSSSFFAIDDGATYGAGHLLAGILQTGISPAPFPAARDGLAPVAPRGWRHGGGRRVSNSGVESEWRRGAE